ncbi:HIT family protein [Ruania zhangjianzhongii]|uniref:HIT family protein n=1 Tax=Ruania zhangjianzhongii TaxID=2603206 RepID=UPI0011C851FB|nr:HIT family protein [Ruania zhangjianzhongii]
MASLFTRIIAGEIPGRFVWTDERCVAFATIEPLQPGHMMVVPREEIAHWVDLPPDLAAHLFAVAQTIGKAQQQAFTPNRIGLLIQGYEVPHTHVHVWPSRSAADFDLSAAATDVPGKDLDAAATTLRQALRTAGHAAHVPED